MTPLVTRTRARHRPALHKAARRHAGNRTRHLAVVPAIPVAIASHDEIVVDRDVVDPRDIGRAGVVDRAVRIARSQRIPGHARAAADTDRRAHAADESNHRRRIARPHRDRPRHPSPPVAEIRPAPVVRRGEAPRRVVDPGPAPRRHPGPVARAVRRPARRFGTREPHGAVAGVLLPVAVVVQRGVSRHVARHVARRDRFVLAGITRGRPLVKAVGARNVARACIGQVRAGEAHALSTAHFDRARVAIKHGGAMPYRNERCRAVRGNVEPVVARFTRHKGQVGCIYLHLLVWRQRAHAQLQRALRQLYLRGVIVEVKYGSGGCATHADCGSPGMKLGTAARVHPEPVARGHRAVQANCRPFVRARRRKAEATCRVRDGGDSGRWVRRLWRVRAARLSGSGLSLFYIAGGRVRAIALCARRSLRQQPSQAKRNWRQQESCMGMHVELPESGGPLRQCAAAIAPLVSRPFAAYCHPISDNDAASHMCTRLCKYIFPGNPARACGTKAETCLSTGWAAGRVSAAGCAGSRSAGWPASGGHRNSPAPRCSHWPAGSRAGRRSPRLRPPRRCAGSGRR